MLLHFPKDLWLNLPAYLVHAKLMILCGISKSLLGCWIYTLWLQIQRGLLFFLDMKIENWLAQYLLLPMNLSIAILLYLRHCSGLFWYVMDFLWLMVWFQNMTHQAGRDFLNILNSWLIGIYLTNERLVRVKIILDCLWNLLSQRVLLYPLSTLYR